MYRINYEGPSKAPAACLLRDVNKGQWFVFVDDALNYKNPAHWMMKTARNKNDAIDLRGNAYRYEDDERIVCIEFTISAVTLSNKRNL